MVPKPEASQLGCPSSLVVTSCVWFLDRVFGFGQKRMSLNRFVLPKGVSTVSLVLVSPGAECEVSNLKDFVGSKKLGRQLACMGNA